MDKCKPKEAKELLDGVQETARECLSSKSRRSKKLRAAFLYNEVIETSAADEDQLQDTLENICSILAAVCNHRELMDVRLKTIPTVWKDMIENLRKYLQVHINDIEREYQIMLESTNQRILDQISHVEEQYSKSERSQQRKTTPDLEGDDLSKWAQMMRGYVTSRKKRDDQMNIGTKEALQVETGDKDKPHFSKESTRAEVLLREALIDSVEEKHKSQKKGTFGPAPTAKEDSKDERSKSREGAKQNGPEDKKIPSKMEVASPP